MAGAGHKTWTRERLTVADVQQYLMDQAVLNYPSAAAADADLLVPEAGMVRYLLDADRYEGRTPSAAGELEGGAWRGLARHWGTFAGAPPTPVSGNPSTPQPGDTAYLDAWRCNAVVGFGFVWRQLEHAEVVTVGGLATIRDAATAAGMSMPAGFRAYVSGTERLYLLRGDQTWRLIGGAAGAGLTLTTGSGAPETGWGNHSGTLQHHGNGMATVQLDIQRTGAAIAPSTTGKVSGNPTLITLPSGWEARTGAAIGPGAGGNRAAFGYIGTSARTISLTSVTGTADIATGATISLAGTYPLATPQDLTA